MQRELLIDDHTGEKNAHCIGDGQAHGGECLCCLSFDVFVYMHVDRRCGSHLVPPEINWVTVHSFPARQPKAGPVGQGIERGLPRKDTRPSAVVARGKCGAWPKTYEPFNQSEE